MFTNVFLVQIRQKFRKIHFEVCIQDKLIFYLMTNLEQYLPNNIRVMLNNVPDVLVKYI
jgi:hypothetical protein